MRPRPILICSKQPLRRFRRAPLLGISRASFTVRTGLTRAPPHAIVRPCGFRKRLPFRGSEFQLRHNESLLSGLQPLRKAFRLLPNIAHTGTASMRWWKWTAIALIFILAAGYGALSYF